MKSKIISKILIILLSSLIICQCYFSYGTSGKITSPDISPNASSIQQLICELNITLGGADGEYASSFAVDSMGNIYLAGEFYNYSTFNQDLILVKLSMEFIPQWNRTWGGGDRENIRGLSIDSDDNIYVAGTTESFGAGDEDFFLSKYDSNGYQQWNRTWGGIDLDRCYGMAIDSYNNIYLAGVSDIFSNRGALVKFDSSGNQLWNRSFIGGDMRFKAIAIDIHDNIYCAANFFDVGSHSWDCGLVKYNNSGSQMWYRSWGGNDYDEADGITIDSFGNIYIIARTRASSLEEFNIWILRYNEDLDIFLWNTTWGGSGMEYSEVIEIDMAGNVYVVGQTNSFGANTFMVKFNYLGKEKWNLTWNDYYYDVLIDSIDRFYLCGTTMGDILLSKCRYGYPNVLNVEIVEQNISDVEFNITFYVYSLLDDINGYNINPISDAEIQIWWNGTGASDDLINLGDGLYFISLTPITVAPGENPILLNMTISAYGYEDKYFETYLAVDPDTLIKEGGNNSEGFPFAILIIVISSIIGGLGVAGVSIVMLRRIKRKGKSL